MYGAFFSCVIIEDPKLPPIFTIGNDEMYFISTLLLLFFLMHCYCRSSNDNCGGRKRNCLTPCVFLLVNAKVVAKSELY